MPNTGKPSLACHLCRKRRVHCDLTPSGCLRCAKIGKTCPGYRQEQDLLFRNKDKQSFTSKGSGGRRKKASCSSVLKTGSKDFLPRSSGKSPSLSNDIFKLDPINWIAIPTPPTLFPQLTEHWHTYCVPIVLNQFCTLANGAPYYGFLGFLPELFCEIKEDSCLGFATKTFVKAYLTNLSRSPPDNELISTYGRALWLTNAAIQDPIECVKDSTVIAVWLLGIHEVVVNSNKNCTVPAPEGYHIHSRGLASLLLLRGRNQFSTRRGRNLFWIIYLFIQTHCLVSNTELPLEFLDWFELLRLRISEDEQFVFAVSTYNQQISSLCMKLRPYIKSLSTEPVPKFQTTTIFAEVDRLQTEIQMWKENKTIDLTKFAPPHFYNSLIAAQLKLHYFEVLLINRMGPQSTTDIPLRRKHNIRTIEILAEEILDNALVALGDLSAPWAPGSGCWADGFRLMWPLLAVCWVPYVRRQQREESRKFLQRIGRHMGIHFALDCEPPPGRFLQEVVSRGS